jgi:RNA ligase
MLTIQDYFKEYENGNLAIQRQDGLILFDYNRTCQFNRAWNPVTLSARGIVFDETTGYIVARPLDKFFNFQELESAEALKNINPNSPFLATTKEDGSMAIIYFYKGTWRINTRGSFQSDQCKWAKVWFDKNVNIKWLNSQYTYIAEIIYPQNRIVVDYKGMEGLILLAARHTPSGEELAYNALKNLGKDANLQVVEMREFHNLEEIAEVCKGLDSNHEGFVIHYPDYGYRLKMKGDEYCKIHKMIANISPLSFWEAFDFDQMKVPDSYMAMLPEEFRPSCEALAEVVNTTHNAIWNRIVEKAKTVPAGLENNRLWFYCQDHFGEDGPWVKTYIDGKHDRVKKGIHKEVRPTGNRFDGVDLDPRLKRILDET